MTPTERGAFEKWHAGAHYYRQPGSVPPEESCEDAAEWGIAYERKRAAAIARSRDGFDHEQHCHDHIAAEIEKGEP